MPPIPFRLFFFSISVAVVGWVAIAQGEESLPPAATRTVDFEKDIRPLLEAKCVKCHGPEKQKSGWRADVKETALKGGDNYAPNIVPGKSAESPLIRFVAGLDADMVMPQKGERFTAEQIGLLRAWIDQGAVWPDQAVAADPRKNHWAFQPLKAVEPPKVDRALGVVRNPIDSFILAQLGAKGLHQSPEADRHTLIRRLNFDLVGLPPTPEEIEAFVNDPDPMAYEKLVDRLLASPHYGERWARHWLDVVRFAESNGFEMNRARPNAWPYRDYVIQAFNDDKPYDQFIREQLAGDALGADSATGFIVGGPWDQVKSPDPVLTAQQRADELHDMVSTTGSAFLGLTLGCARCHNHKFDPISQVDYYAVTAALQGVRHGERVWHQPGDEEKLKRAETLRAEVAPIRAGLAKYQTKALPLRVVLLDDNAPPSTSEKAGVTAIKQPKSSQPTSYTPGTARGQASDPGDFARLPNLAEGYRYWLAEAGKSENFFSWDPKLTGRFRIWVSWATWPSHTKDVRYVLDRDGDLNTTDDQVEIAKLDQSTFADGTPAVPGEKRWSGLYNAGVHELTAGSRIILRSGKMAGPTVADAVLFEEVTDEPNSKTAVTSPHLRPPVMHHLNEEYFDATDAKFVRFTVLGTTGHQLCLDELEVFTTGAGSHNVALASAGGKATASSVFDDGRNPKHQIAHLIDGLYGNDHSWIPKETRGGWAQIELPQIERIGRIVWSRDRSGVKNEYDDRLPTDYRIEVSLDGQQWKTVASASDRLAIEYRKRITGIPTLSSVSGDQLPEAAKLNAQRLKLEGEIKTLTTFPQVYAGKFETPVPTYRLHRGDPMQKKEEVVPAGLLEFGGDLHLATDTPDQPRRIALADWIVSQKNPLTARVFVNRLWQSHFGTGIVETPSDFGLNGARPTHPELLDWLAGEFMAHGWKVKELQRLIVLSATYRQSSRVEEKAFTLDAGTRLLWRFPSQRLEAEPLRDAILAVSGQLDLRMGGPGFDLFEPNDNYVKIYYPKHAFEAGDFRRMVYQNKPRMQLDDVFGAFDCPDAGQIAPRRTSSTTPLQALNLLNSTFAIEQADAFAARLEKETGASPAEEVPRAFQLAFGRSPTPEEDSAAQALIAEHGLKILCRALFNANEFINIF